MAAIANVGQKKRAYCVMRRPRNFCEISLLLPLLAALMLSSTRPDLQFLSIEWLRYRLTRISSASVKSAPLAAHSKR